LLMMCLWFIDEVVSLNDGIDYCVMNLKGCVEAVAVQFQLLYGHVSGRTEGNHYRGCEPNRASPECESETLPFEATSTKS
jgi:hypothetical protein